MHIAHREDRSAASFLLHNLFIRPFAKQLRKPDFVDHEGSPRLSAPNSVLRTCKIQERRVGNVWIYDIILKRVAKTNPDPTRRNKRIYYFAGGSWQSPADDAHFKFIASLAQRVSQPTIFSLVSLPLAPHAPAPKSMPVLLELYQSLMEEPSFEEEDVCFAGDSSGGNIALALTMYCLDLEDPPCHQSPHSLVLISPTVDLVHDHPDLEEAAKKDPIENLDFIKHTAATWAGDMPYNDPRISPTHGNINALADHGIRVYIVVAGHDILGVEATVFAEKCRDAGVEGRVLLWHRQMHNFPLTGAYRLPEGVKSLDWLALAFDEGGLAMNEHTMEKFEQIEEEKEQERRKHQQHGEDAREKRGSTSEDGEIKPSKKYRVLKMVKEAKAAIKEELTHYHPSA